MTTAVKVRGALPRTPEFIAYVFLTLPNEKSGHPRACSNEFSHDASEIAPFV
jgi:hypothetical protein